MKRSLKQNTLQNSNFIIMKKIIIIHILLAIPLLAWCDNITFADEEVKAICVKNWDTNSDGELSKAEAAAVTDLGEFFYENSSINTFDELQYFTGLVSIGDRAFTRCSSLKSITIPNTVTSIGDGAFGYCTSLTNIIIPNCVTRIGSSAFYGCTGLTSFTIPNSVTEIHMQAFQNCTSLTSIAIPNGVKQINHYTFAGCTALTSVTIPNSMTRFGPYVFQNCSSLTSITIPNSVTEIEGPVFDGCSKLISVKVEMTNPVSIVAKTFSNRANATLYVPKGSKAVYQAADYWKEFKEIVEYEVDENINFADAEVKAICVKNWDTNGDGELSKAEAAAVTSLGTVFKGTSITTFDELQYFTSLTAIGDFAFQHCSYLTSVRIPAYVIKIGSYAFHLLRSLKNITFPNSLESIGECAFSGCGLTCLNLPISLKTISRWAFEACSSITSISVSNGNKYLDSRDNCNAVIESSSNTLILGCKNTDIPSSVTSIENTAFSDCGLTNITIPNSVISIGYGAFYGCDFYTSLNFGIVQNTTIVLPDFRELEK